MAVRAVTCTAVPRRPSLLRIYLYCREHGQISSEWLLRISARGVRIGMLHPTPKDFVKGSFPKMLVTQPSHMSAWIFRASRPAGVGIQTAEGVTPPSASFIILWDWSPHTGTQVTNSHLEPLSLFTMWHTQRTGEGIYDLGSRFHNSRTRSRQEDTGSLHSVDMGAYISAIFILRHEPAVPVPIHAGAHLWQAASFQKEYLRRTSLVEASVIASEGTVQSMYPSLRASGPKGNAERA
ncbi:hypothetical protein GLOTRDRAFT_90048 [Gloeophyllum trabeum ATCC 11539]|uniref:Uncharacterized protein n=1 Tax=Gloeophyllum trabeum (strain ATCC 11539 / FP-39264 / Madison 617) TaxID=670483 RepID=S7S415_GLOTA|nr:uncharacterized protein GLOTRDRAFT_90048 [Gloeophyllum trabeum ATCC 11539]EPQ60589.1 hypothetical protein GLOTRDRAFT_90048 [Gloeophyllum trabeum ATCC 11539]